MGNHGDALAGCFEPSIAHPESNSREADRSGRSVRSDHGGEPLVKLLERDVIGLPTTYTAREALDGAFAAIGESFSTLAEAANGTIAQALAAAGRGVTVVTDDPRFDQMPLGVRRRPGAGAPAGVSRVFAFEGLPAGRGYQCGGLGHTVGIAIQDRRNTPTSR